MGLRETTFRDGHAPSRRLAIRVVALAALLLSLTVPWALATRGVAHAGNGVVGVAGTYGAITIDTSGTWRELELATKQRSTNVRVNVNSDKVATGVGQNVVLIARRTGPDTEYRVRLRFAPDGGVSFAILRIIHGARTYLSPQTKIQGVTRKPGSFVAVRVVVRDSSPTTISVRVWTAGQTEPTAWSRVVTDNNAELAQAGWLGIRFGVPASTTNVPVRYLYDRVAVSTDPGTDPTPTPTPSPTPTPTPDPSATPAPTVDPTPTRRPSTDAHARQPPDAGPDANADPKPDANANADPTPTPRRRLAPTGVPANSYVVSTSGNDASNGSASSPWRTLQKAADTVSAGATVLVRNGTYAGFTMRRSGTAGNPITFAAYPGEQPVIDGQGAVAYTVRLVGVTRVRLIGLTVAGGYADRQAGGGVSVESSSYVDVMDSLLRDNHSYGVRTYQSTYVTIDNNEITGNAVGVHIDYGGEGVVVSNNLIHDNNLMMVNTPRSENPNDDAGAEGVALVHSTGHVLVTHNMIWGNRAPSYDYGYDGGAFSIYMSSNWTITDNVTWDNHNVLETGTDSNMTPCANNTFTHNLNYAATSADVTVGMMLRCGSNMLIANNTFVGMQTFVFALSHNRAGWGGSIAGMHIVNNIIDVSSAKIFGVDTAMPSDVVIDNNLIHMTGSSQLATVYGHGGTNSLATFTSWTGFQVHGLMAAAGFVDASANDFRLQTDSAAIDAGQVVSPWTNGYAGAAPDLGYKERG